MRAPLFDSKGLVLDFFEAFLSPLESELKIQSSHTLGKAHGMVDVLTYDARIEATNFAMDADEAFCAGTAAVISPIGSIEHGGSIATYCDGEVGAITKQLYDALTSIQEGRATDTFGWTPSV